MKLPYFRSFCLFFKFQSRSILARTSCLTNKSVTDPDLLCFMSVLNGVELHIFYWFSSGSSRELETSSAKSLEFSNSFQLCYCSFPHLHVFKLCWWHFSLNPEPPPLCSERGEHSDKGSAFTQVWGLAPASPSSVVEGLQIQRERAFVKDKNPVTGSFSEQRSYTDGCCSCDGLSIQENLGL